MQKLERFDCHVTAIYNDEGICLDEYKPIDGLYYKVCLADDVSEIESFNEQIIKDLVIMVDRLSNLSLEFYDLSKKYNQIIGDVK